MSVIRSLKHAIHGVSWLAKQERNFKIHLLATLVVVPFMLFLPMTEALIILLAIGLVLTTEALNTAIEKTIDLAKPDFHPLAKIAKDTAAGAVLIVSILALIVGATIFINHFLMK